MTVKTKLLFFFICVFPVALFAQGLFTVHQQADSCFRKGDYRHAYPLYMKLAFFNQDTSQDSLIYIRRAICAEFSGDYGNAADFYFSAYTKTSSDSIQLLILFSCLRNLLPAPAYDPFMVRYQSLDTVNFTPAEKLQANTYLLYAAVLHNQPEDVVIASRHLAALLPPDKVTELNALNKKWFAAMKKSEGKAATYSLLLPGSGQLYAGSPRDAANSFVVNAVIVGAFLATTITVPVVDAALFWVSPFVHYYAGGAHAAADLVAPQKRKKQKRLLREYYSWSGGVIK